MGGAEGVRDFAISALVFAFGAFVWFGWGQESPPRGWRPAMVVGSVLSGVMIVAGALLTWRLWGRASVFDDGATRRIFGIISGIEFGLCFLGAAVLGITKRSRYLAAWILLVVGVHFVPLAVIFHDAGLAVLTAAAVRCSSSPCGRRSSPSARSVDGSEGVPRRRLAVVQCVWVLAIV